MGFAKPSGLPPAPWLGMEEVETPSVSPPVGQFIFYRGVMNPTSKRYTNMTWRSGTSEIFNWDIGIYDSNFVALYRKGSTAAPAANSFVNTAIDITLAVGFFWLAFVVAGTGVNAQFAGRNTPAYAGWIRRQGGVVFPLPAVGVPEVWPDGSIAICPLLVIT